MKILMVAIGLMLPVLAMPAVAQAPNDRASELQAGKDYTTHRRAMRRARPHRSLFHRDEAPPAQR